MEEKLVQAKNRSPSSIDPVYAPLGAPLCRCMRKLNFRELCNTHTPRGSADPLYAPHSAAAIAE